MEVLPPANSQDQDLARILAWLLDDLIPIPGTSYRIGLDALVGLIPGVGDTSATAVGSLILLQGLRCGVPRVVIARMALNLQINGAGGAVPGVGDVFSAWFKSNRRNYQLLLAHAQAGKRVSTVGDWVFLIAVFVFVVGLALTITVAAGFIVFRFFSFLFGQA